MRNYKRAVYNGIIAFIVATPINYIFFQQLGRALFLGAVISLSMAATYYVQDYYNSR